MVLHCSVVMRKGSGPSIENENGLYISSLFSITNFSFQRIRNISPVISMERAVFRVSSAHFLALLTVPLRKRSLNTPSSSFLHML